MNASVFVLNFVGATSIGLALLAPIERMARRFGSAAVSLGGIGLAATSFVFLFVSERTSLFGFQEPGYDPPAIAFSRVAEILAVTLLSAFVAARVVARVRMPRC